MRRPVALLALAISCVVSGVACTRGGTSGDASEHRFVKASVGTVRDTTTGLIWTAHDHEQNYAWPDAERHCDTLTVDEQSGWRLPEIDELSALYDETENSACGERTCRLNSALTLTDPYVWSATGRPSGRRFYIDFKFGTRLAPVTRPRLVRRVLCVRED